MSVVALASAEHTEEDKQRWLEFKLEHGKMFLSPGKEKDRMNTFLENAKEVDAHNEAFENGEVLFEKALHKFSDLSEEAFLEKFTGVNVPAEARTVDPSTLVTLRQTPPSSLNLADKMYGWTVRSQGGCGSCWTFSAGASIEYAYFKKWGYVTDVSEQHMVDCVYGTKGGCSGGWMPTAFNWLKDNGGISWEQQYPYTGVSSTCKASSIPNKGIFMSSTAYSQVANDDTSIKNALNLNGVLAICVDAGDWSAYRSGIFTSANYASPSCTHAVALVGYATCSQTGIPYWIVRNSWGDSWWGEKGYIRLDARRDSTGKTYGGAMLNYAFYPNLQ